MNTEKHPDWLPPQLPWDVPPYVTALYYVTAWAVVLGLRLATFVLYAVITVMILRWWFGVDLLPMDWHLTPDSHAGCEMQRA